MPVYKNCMLKNNEDGTQSPLILCKDLECYNKCVDLCIEFNKNIGDVS